MKQKFILIFFVALFFSCTSDLDFDQADHLDIAPVIEADFIYFDLSKPNLTDYNGEFRSSISDTMKIDVFDDGDIKKAFIKAEVEVAYENSFERNFFSELIFTDENDLNLASATLNIKAANDNVVKGDTVYVFDKQTYPGIINAKKIILNISISPNTLPIEDKTLHFQSKIKVYTQTTLEK